MKTQYSLGLALCLSLLISGCGKGSSEKTVLEAKIVELSNSNLALQTRILELQEKANLTEQQNKLQLLKAYNVCKETYDNILTFPFNRDNPLHGYNWVNYYQGQKQKLEEAVGTLAVFLDSKLHSDPTGWSLALIKHLNGIGVARNWAWAQFYEGGWRILPDDLE